MVVMMMMTTQPVIRTGLIKYVRFYILKDFETMTVCHAMHVLLLLQGRWEKETLHTAFLQCMYIHVRFCVFMTRLMLFQTFYYLPSSNHSHISYKLCKFHVCIFELTTNSACFCPFGKSYWHCLNWLHYVVD